MNIKDIKVTQRKLKRPEQISELVKIIKDGTTMLEPIELFKTTDNEIICNNGHHRLAAYWLSGRTTLEDYEYYELLCNTDKMTFGNIEKLIKSLQ